MRHYLHVYCCSVCSVHCRLECPRYLLSKRWICDRGIWYERICCSAWGICFLHHIYNIKYILRVYSNDQYIDKQWKFDWRLCGNLSVRWVRWSHDSYLPTCLHSHQQQHLCCGGQQLDQVPVPLWWRYDWYLLRCSDRCYKLDAMFCFVRRQYGLHGLHILRRRPRQRCRSLSIEKSNHRVLQFLTGVCTSVHASCRYSQGIGDIDI